MRRSGNDSPVAGLPLPPELRLELLDRREALLQLGGQLLEKPVGRHADGLLRVAQRVLDDDLVLPLAEAQADARMVPLAPEPSIDGRQVEVHRADIDRKSTRLNSSHL